MSKCLKCGASLPPVGDCPTCAAAAQPAGRAVPSLLDKDILIDRRRGPERDASAPVPSTPAPATPPGMMARAPVPPGLTPAPRTPASGTPGLPVMPPRPPAQAAAPAAQAPAMPSAHALRPQVVAPRAPVPPPPQAPAFNLPGVAAPAPRAAAPTVGAPTASAPAPRQASAPGLPVMPPRPNVAAPPAQPPAPPSLELTEEESFSVEVEDAEPVAPPVAAAPARPAPAPAPVARKAPAAQPDELEVHARPASLWRRLLALTIDTSAIAGVAALYLMLASSVAGVKTPQTGLSGLDAFVVQLRALESVLVPGVFLVLVLSLVYCTMSAFLWNGRTLGRRLLGLRLVDTHGLAPAPGRAVIRALLAGLSFGLFLAGFWMALFDRRGQTLHDKLTSTYVVQPS